MLRLLLTVVVVFFPALMPSVGGQLYAQTRKVMNRPYIDQRKFHYGFLAGINLQDIEYQNNGFIDENGNQ